MKKSIVALAVIVSLSNASDYLNQKFKDFNYLIEDGSCVKATQEMKNAIINGINNSVVRLNLMNYEAPPKEGGNFVLYELIVSSSSEFHYGVSNLTQCKKIAKLVKSRK